MTVLIAAPLVVPLLAACLCILSRADTQRRINLAGAVGLLICAVLLLSGVLAEGEESAGWVLQVGGWRAPFGITLMADAFGAVMVVVTAILHLVVSVYSLTDIDRRRQRFGYFPLLNALTMGVCGAFLTGDLFNLYVWFEVMLMASFVLLVLGGGREQMEAGIKYVALSLMSSALFLAAAGILYGMAATLNMADLSVRLAIVSEQNPWLVVAAGALLLVAFGIKSAVFPLYFWLPASYHTPPPAVSALFAGLLTKVGVYSLIRVFTLVLPPSDYLLNILLVVAGLSMITGVLGAVSQMEVRRILSFHIISQIGYMVMGLALLSAEDPHVRQLGVAASVFYIVHHIIVKANLFLIGGTIGALTGTERLSCLGGLAVSSPALAVLFLIPALSLAGVPPLSGFWAKLAVLRAGLLAGQYLLVAAALFTGLITLMSMIKIWNYAFWGRPPEGQSISPAEPAGNRPRRGALALRIAPSAALALLTVGIGLYPDFLMRISERAASQMLGHAAVELVLPAAAVSNDGGRMSNYEWKGVAVPPQYVTRPSSFGPRPSSSLKPGPEEVEP